jgi:small subunit ribosomal protein S16
VATRIRLKRLGKIRNPQYRIVVADARTKRDGRVIEEVGKYHPKEEPSLIEVNSERVQYWLSVGAQPSEPVQAILSKTGDWQQFKGLPAPEPLKVAGPRRNKQEIYEAEAKAAGGGADKPATTEPRKRSPRKAADKPAAEKAAAEKPAADKAPADKAPAAKAAADKPAADKPAEAATDAGAES